MAVRRRAVDGTARASSTTAVATAVAVDTAVSLRRTQHRTDFDGGASPPLQRHTADGDGVDGVGRDDGDGDCAGD